LKLIYFIDLRHFSDKIEKVNERVINNKFSGARVTKMGSDG